LVNGELKSTGYAAFFQSLHTQLLNITQRQDSKSFEKGGKLVMFLRTSSV